MRPPTSQWTPSSADIQRLGLEFPRPGRVRRSLSLVKALGRGIDRAAGQAERGMPEDGGAFGGGGGGGARGVASSWLADVRRAG
jgi:hypothetical protein